MKNDSATIEEHKSSPDAFTDRRHENLFLLLVINSKLGRAEDGAHLYV